MSSLTLFAGAAGDEDEDERKERKILLMFTLIIYIIEPWITNAEQTNTGHQWTTIFQPALGHWSASDLRALSLRLLSSLASS